MNRNLIKVTAHILPEQIREVKGQSHHLKSNTADNREQRRKKTKPNVFVSQTMTSPNIKHSHYTKLWQPSKCIFVPLRFKVSGPFWNVNHFSAWRGASWMSGLFVLPSSARWWSRATTGLIKGLRRFRSRISNWIFSQFSRISYYSQYAYQQDQILEVWPHHFSQEKSGGGGGLADRMTHCHLWRLFITSSFSQPSQGV